jgi:hypothetical protein
LGFGPHLVVRLSHDPTSLTSNETSRDVEVDWLPRAAKAVAVEFRRTISWADVEGALLEGCADMVYTVPEKQLTENAAVAVFALLISELEQGRIRSLAPLGSGADYWAEIEGGSTLIFAEVSGIRRDAGGQCTTRLEEKTAQVLSRENTRVGFVSVTAFSHGDNSAVRSYLHFVKKERREVRRNRRRKRRKK